LQTINNKECKIQQRTAPHFSYLTHNWKSNYSNRRRRSKQECRKLCRNVWKYATQWV